MRLLIICLLMILNVSAYENVFLERQFFAKKRQRNVNMKVCLRQNVTDIDKLNYF